MPKARLYFDGDNTGIEKNARIYSLTQDVGDKLDSIPNVIDNTNSTSTIDALSANMGRDLQEQINNLASRGRFLSTWDCTTGLPTTQPQTSPYVYRAGDYYIVSATGATNYRPHGSEYTAGVASTTVETLTVDVNDLYIYDGVQWTLQGTGHGTSVAWGTIVGNIADQVDLQTALFEKADKVNVLEKNNTTSYTPTADYHPATKKYTDDNDTYVGTSAPTNNVVEGRLWYDAVADVLKVYDGSAWVPTGKTYTAGSHINISNADVISTIGLQEELTAGDNITIGDECTTESDMKGPCPSGFHIETDTERQIIYDIGVALGARGSSLTRYSISRELKMPLGGNISRNNISNQGSAGRYRHSTTNQNGIPYNFRLASTFRVADTYLEANQAAFIRPIKNTSIAPDGSWTMTFDGSSVATGAGIFHNATLGLISLSSDGNTWYTITDKNLGATTVWNDGDALSEANCGNSYQWGNNYGFSYVIPQPVTTVEIQDLSLYGPGNYYSNNKFYNGNDGWGVLNNKNLRGGVSQGTFQDCIHNVISATDTTYTASDFDIKDLTDSTGLRTTWSGKQDALTAGSHIDIINNVVSTTGLQEELIAGDNITIGDECTTESDMKGPASIGFHVPSTAEWQTVYNIWTALGGGGTDGTNFGIALKLPFAGNRNNSSANVTNQGTGGYYWSSSQYDANNAYYLYFYSTGLNPQNHRYRTYGFSIRCFKNTPTIPASSWVKLYGTSIENGGIFWNSADGLISLSSDGQTWITIADKNLGATTVWNNGDALSEANCGKHYQWGNNYGFPRTGGITTSSTQVDASNYGPGNYYSSDTFITYSGRWDSTDNGNLWGGVTQGTWQDCIYNVISAIDTTYTASDFDIKDLTDSTNLRTTWSGKQDKMSAGERISFSDITFNARRGPCPEGWHIPSEGEWTGVKSIFSTLGIATTADAVANLHLPLNGSIAGDASSPDIVNQGSRGVYWSSSVYRSYVPTVYLNTNSRSTNTSAYRSMGANIRAFKDELSIPDSTWTVIQGTLGGAGVFWDQTNGLISIMSDGITGYTIMDKNLGATVVYNNGDTMSEANCGYYYQRGNNYGFSRSGPVTTSTTLVDASDYGPTNPYLSSTFIYGSGVHDWSSIENDDLRGDVSGIATISNIISADLQVDDTAYAPSWDGVVDVAPSKNAVYDKTESLNTMLRQYSDEHGPVIPVYYYHGTFSSDITCALNEAGTFRVTINGYHSGNLNRTITINADGTDVASYQSNVIEVFSFMSVVSANTSLKISIDSTTAFTIHDVYIEKINVQSGYLTATVN